MKLNPLILTLTTVTTLNIMIQFKPGSTNPSDTTCLTQLHSSFLNPTHLTNWTPPFFSNPCYNGFDSYLLGITCNNGRIYRLSLPNLNLGGTVSQYVSQCSDLQALDLSSNSLTGTIPDTITDLSNLAVLNLSNNKLTGVIPTNLYLCAYLNVIDLHSNLLDGTLSPQLGLLNRLKTIDVSYNKLSGMIPASLGSRRNVTDFIGNKDLFGYPLGAYKKDNKGLSVMAIVAIGLGSGLLSLVISFAIVCVWLKVSEHKMAAMEEAKITHLMPDY